MMEFIQLVWNTIIPGDSNAIVTILLLIIAGLAYDRFRLAREVRYLIRKNDQLKEQYTRELTATIEKYYKSNNRVSEVVHDIKLVMMLIQRAL